MTARPRRSTAPKPRARKRSREEFVRAARGRLGELSNDELDQVHDLLERLLNSDELSDAELKRLESLLKP